MWDNKRGAKNSIMLHYRAFVARARVYAPQFIRLTCGHYVSFYIIPLFNIMLNVLESYLRFY